MHQSSKSKSLSLLFGVVLATLPLTTTFATTPATGPTTMPANEPSAGPHDFDFLVGRWYAHSRRLAKPLSGSDEWVEFDSVHDGVLLPSGFGVADDYRIEGRPDFLGLALQVYDPATRQWRAYWYRLGAMTPPLLGTFRDGVGVFEGPDQHEGKPIITRYTWSQITATAARWEQAFSADGGKTWETNWVMDYSRTRSAPKE
jgi:hypothetical protein